MRLFVVEAARPSNEVVDTTPFIVLVSMPVLVAKLYVFEFIKVVLVATPFTLE